MDRDNRKMTRCRRIELALSHESYPRFAGMGQIVGVLFAGDHHVKVSGHQSHPAANHTRIALASISALEMHL